MVEQCMSNLIYELGMAIADELAPGIASAIETGDPTIIDHSEYERAARRALELLRQPTQAMMDAGCGFAACWDAMLDEARREAAE